ncbi:PPOX class F420-dependent oxidoreductase [Nocardioides hungaricus]
MPELPFPDAVRALLEKPNPAVVATLRPDGAPVSVATWYLLDGDRILLNMDRTRVRLAHVRRDPRVSLTVLDEAGWYTHVSLVGAIEEMYDDEGLADIDRLSTHYGGQPYPDRESPRVSAWMAVERWHGWGAAKED